MTALEDTLRNALAVNAGVLAALARQQHVAEGSKFRLRHADGEASDVTLGEVLDLADAALEHFKVSAGVAQLPEQPVLRPEDAGANPAPRSTLAAGGGHV